MLRTALFTAAAFAATASAAHAQNYGDRVVSGPYVSAGYNYLDFDDDIGGAGGVSALTGRGGWRFGPYFSLEGDISFGIDGDDFDFSGSEDDLDFDDNIDGDFDDVLAGPGELGLDYLIGGYARASWPVSDQFEVFGRVGYAFAEVDKKILTGFGNEVEFGGSDDGIAFGGGAAYHLSDNVSVRADYTHYDFEDGANAESLGISLQLAFGG